MTAAVFLDAELLVAEDRMTLGLGIPSLFSLLSTVRTAILSYVKQYRLFLSECILSFSPATISVLYDAALNPQWLLEFESRRLLMVSRLTPS